MVDLVNLSQSRITGRIILFAVTDVEKKILKCVQVPLVAAMINKRVWQREIICLLLAWHSFCHTSLFLPAKLIPSLTQEWILLWTKDNDSLQELDS